MARSDTGKLLTVCNYDPHTNFWGTYWENVKFKVEKVDVELYRKQILEHTNNFRKNHPQVDPLVLDDAISAFAQEWADTLAKNDKLEHRPKNAQKFGENVFMGSEINECWPTDYWYNEIAEFEWDNMEKESTRHFTQLVWKASKKLGVGVARSEQGNWYVVCNYDPSGNVPGKFGDNVKPDYDLNEYRKKLLTAINALRKEYHAEPIVLDETMNKNAQATAEKYSKGKVEFEPSLQFCTVFYSEGTDCVANPTHLWFVNTQEKALDWKKLEDNKADTFTQAIWQSTKKMGAGIFRKGNNFYTVTCFYPKGNLKGKFADNCKPK
uniref:SCP domain-containing protein n=1 Tax=Panagrellus redivivus TaxID=6233 RepID=A0A7E4UN71_PANRE